MNNHSSTAVFHYDPSTGAYRHASTADISPLEPRFVLVPAYATLIPPPPIPDGKYAAFDGSAWHLLDAVGPVAEVIAETPAQTIARYEYALDSHLDATARMYRYDNRFTFALRAAYPGPWHDEAVTFAEWMDSCNAQAFELLQSVQDGEAEMPTVEGFISGLPDFVLP